MEPLVRTARTVRARGRVHDSWVDRLSCRYTVVLLILFTVLVGLASWVRNPMTCWLPKNYDIDQRPYLKLYCWVENTYYLPFSREIPRPEEHEQKRVLLYYQWIPYILLAQAFCFWLPSGVWHWLSAKSGLDTRGILEMTFDIQNTIKQDSREERLEDLTSYLDYFLIHRSRRQARNPREKKTCHNSTCCSGSFLTLSYIFVKFLYLANLVLQLLALTGLLNTHYFSHGADYISYHQGGANSTEDGAMWNSPIFPKVAFCDYVLRELGNTRRHTTQCVMNYNIYLERLYVFLWFWIMLLLLLTTVDFLVWLLRNLIPGDRVKFVNNQLHVGNAVTRGNQEMTSSFTDHYLGPDGVLVLRIIAQNVSVVTAVDVTVQLWKTWMTREYGAPSGDSKEDEKYYIASKSSDGRKKH